MRGPESISDAWNETDGDFSCPQGGFSAFIKKKKKIKEC
jgi:hypothetical protein